MKKRLLLFLLIAIVFPSVASDVPSTINIEGFVFDQNNEGVDNGVPVIIENTDLQQNTTTEVFAPGPFLAGIYSASINGEIGDFVNVYAYNDTHYGLSSKLITSSTSQINVTMNNTRSPETIVEIISPSNNSFFNMTDIFNVTVNVTAIVDDLLNCEVFINVSNENVLSPLEDFQSIPSLAEGSSTLLDFEINSSQPGNSNITASVSCENTGIFFEGNKDDSINVFVVDQEPPVINITNPENETEEKGNNTIIFEYDVQSNSPISECSLFVNNSLISTDTGADVGINTFEEFITNGFYEFYISCEDQFNNTGFSSTFFLTVSVFEPNITSIVVPENIVLNAGSTKDVECLVTVEDLNGAEDISNVEAILYSQTTGIGVDNETNHYTNSSCEEISSTGNVGEYSCGFSLQYFAINGSWTCNVTATDNQGLKGNFFNNTNVDTLYAINLSTNVIDYGEVSAGAISEEESINVINIGNQPINVAVRGYGGEDPLSGEGYAMKCDNNINISIDNKRYGLIEQLIFDDKTELTSQDEDTGLQISILDNAFMYWQLRVPGMQVTNCEGRVVYTAVAP